MPVPVDHATGSFYLLHILCRWKYADATVGIGNENTVRKRICNLSRIEDSKRKAFPLMQNRKLRRESTRIYSKKEKDMEANASTNAEFVLATLGNDAGMYGAVKMVL